MKQSFDSPRLLIVTEGLEYDRKGGRFMSLEPIFAQERGALASAVGKVSAIESGQSQDNAARPSSIQTASD